MNIKVLQNAITLINCDQSLFMELPGSYYSVICSGEFRELAINKGGILITGEWCSNLVFDRKSLK